MGRPGGPDSDVLHRRSLILSQMSAREAPRVLLLFVAVIVLFDLGFAAIGSIAPVGYYVSDVIQATANVVVAVLIMKGVIPPKWAPAAFASAIVVDNLALNYQYSVVGTSAAGVTLLTMTVYGAITLRWRPFLISAVWMGVLTSYVYISLDPEGGLGWALTAITALVVSGVVMYGRIAAVTPLAEASRTIEEMATRDALTGALNRHGLDLATRLLTPLAARADAPMFAVFVDVTGLKATNDNHGHDVGDRVIRATADALRAHCRDGDLLCRWGGDEFVVVGIGRAPDPDEYAARVIRSVAMEDLDGRWVPRLHIGVSESVSGDVERLIREADASMYSRRNSPATEPSA